MRSPIRFQSSVDKRDDAVQSTYGRVEGVSVDGVAEVEESATFNFDGVAEILPNEGEEGAGERMAEFPASFDLENDA